MTSTNLTNHFLIALPCLEGSCFEGSLTYICEHSVNKGAVGIVINKPLQASLVSLLENVDVDAKNSDISSLPVYFGGPVQADQGFVLHRPLGSWNSTSAVTADIGLTTSKDILTALGTNSIADQSSLRDFIVSVGYAGWSPGQLEEEIVQNSWLSVKADPSIIFDTSYEKRFKAAVDSVGISMLDLASGVYGHA